MGWYFRKSKSIGPFRVNFSNSGTSFSTGIKGARISFGPKGTFVNVGRNGIYYRTKLGSAEKSSNSRSTSDSSYSQIVDAITVQEYTQGVSVSNQAIVKDIKRASLINCLWMIFSALLIVCVGWWALPVILFLRIIMNHFFRAEVHYEMDPDAAHEWEKFSELFAMLGTSKKMWVINTSQYIENAKINAGAGQNLTRSRLKLTRVKPNRVAGFGVFSNFPCIKLKAKRCIILFLPCDIIIKKGGNIVACSYKNLNIDTGTTSFIETNSVPTDAAILQYTWQYVNKDGSADKRYSGNRQLPVCQYGNILLQAGDQIRIEIHVSNAAVAENIGAAFRYYANYLDKLLLRNQMVSQISATQDKNIDEAPSAANISTAANDRHSGIFEGTETCVEQNDLIDEMMMFLKEE